MNKTPIRAPEDPGDCTCPMWSGYGSSDGFCGKLAWGPQIPGETFRDAWTGEVRRLDGRFRGYVSGLACPAHGGPKRDEPRVFQDGYAESGRPMYCAVMPDFINLQESPAEFHEKPWLAARALLSRIGEGGERKNDGQ